MITAISLLKNQTDESFALVQKGMADVDDAMLHWEPSPGSWGLRQKRGYWIPDYDQPKAIPPGPKTIGWLASHIATCKDMYYEYAFGPAKKTWYDLRIPGDSAGLREYMERTHLALKSKLDEIVEGGLEQMVATNWGEPKPLWGVFWIMIYHDIEHGGQIMQVKNEYRKAIRTI